VENRVKKEVPDEPAFSDMLAGLNEAESPVAVDTVAFSVTMPVNPRLVMLTSVDDWEPAGNGRIELEDMLKSQTLKVAVAEWTIDPFLPVTVIV